MFAALPPEKIAELYAAGELLILAAGRPLGFALTFTAFVWGRINSGLLRIAFGLAVALPVMAPLWTVAQPTVAALPAPFTLLVVKELFFGALIGFLASLPFEAMGMAGAIIDNVRGSGAPLSSPGGEITPFGQAFVATSLWLFASLGGFWMTTDILYSSYGGWPLLATMPDLTTDGLSAFTHFLARLGRLALLVAAPLMALLLAIDFIFTVAARLGKRVDVTFLVLSVKSLVALICLPFFAMTIVRVATGEIQALPALSTLLAAALR